MADNTEIAAEPSAPPLSFTANISYHITIKTGDKPSAGTDANVYFALHGDKGETPRITLQDESQTFKRFEGRRVDKFAVQTADIGKLEKLVIGHDNKGEDPAWYLEEVDANIPGRDEHYKFRYGGWLGGEPDQRKEAVLIPDISYHMTIKTGVKPSAGTDASVYIALHGDKGETPRITLQDESQTFKRFERKFAVQTADVGKLEKIVIGHDNKGEDPACYLEEVDVNIPGRDEHYKFRYGGWLGGEPDQRKEAVLFPGLSPQAPGTHPINVGSTTSLPSFYDLPQFRITCGHCSAIFVVHTTSKLVTCPHCRRISSVGYFALRQGIIYAILGVIFLAAGVGVTVAKLTSGYSAIWVGAFVSGSASLMRCCYYYSMTVSSIRPDSAIETAHAQRGQTTSMPLHAIFNFLNEITSIPE